jgi:hypothetical protein
MLAIKDLKDLGKLIDLCRKKGVENIKVDGIDIKLGELPEVRQTDVAYSLPPEAHYPITPNVTAIATDELTEEQLLFYSTGNEQE